MTKVPGITTNSRAKYFSRIVAGVIRNEMRLCLEFIRSNANEQLNAIVMGRANVKVSRSLAFASSLGTPNARRCASP